MDAREEWPRRPPAHGKPGRRVNSSRLACEPGHPSLLLIGSAPIHPSIRFRFACDLSSDRLGLWVSGLPPSAPHPTSSLPPFFFCWTSRRDSSSYCAGPSKASGLGLKAARSEPLRVHLRTHASAGDACLKLAARNSERVPHTHAHALSKSQPIPSPATHSWGRIVLAKQHSKIAPF